MRVESRAKKAKKKLKNQTINLPLGESIVREKREKKRFQKK